MCKPKARSYILCIVCRGPHKGHVNQKAEETTFAFISKSWLTRGLLLIPKNAGAPGVFSLWGASDTIGPMDILIAALASLFAGFVDAIVGGGGLILLPALFSVFPSAPPATVLGINKGTSIWGTAVATVQYAQRVNMRWAALIPGALCALGGSWGGAWLVTQVSPDVLRRLLPAALLVVFFYTLLRKDFGQTHAPRFHGRAEALAMGALGLVIGFYDGFFGPGTGSFFVFILVRWLSYDFMHASAAAKLLNTASNLAALSLFAWGGHILWSVVGVTAVANVLGSVLGARLAIKHGSGFVRVFFMVVVAALIVKTGVAAYS